MNREALKAAAAWHAQLCSDEAGPEDHAAHARWLQAAADHRWAWQQLQALRTRLGAVPGPQSAQVLEAVRHERAGRRSVLRGLALLGGAGAATWLGYRELPALTASHRTAAGERKHFTLADGSTLILNTDSRVDVLFDAQQRLIHLHRGEILLQSATDPARRPLRVRTRDGDALALGTRFTVRQLDGATRVGVEAHAVALQPADAPGLRRVLHAGEQGEFSRSALLPADTALVASGDWVHGMLVVADMPLAQFVAELARYRPGYLGCAPEVGGLHLSGAFPVDDTDRALAAVAQALPVRVRRVTRYWARVEGA